MVVGQDGILSTPAASHLVRTLSAQGAFILTASHNPGGPNGDFGIKFNGANGGPASELITNAAFAHTKTLTSFNRATLSLTPNINEIGETHYTCVGNTTRTVSVVDSCDAYVALMQSIFSFPALKSLLSAPSATGSPAPRILIDSMHGVTGPYSTRIFCDTLGAPLDSTALNAVPLPDFGGGHPDPNLTYAHELVERMRAGGIMLGAASDGDGVRYKLCIALDMICHSYLLCL